MCRVVPFFSEDGYGTQRASQARDLHACHAVSGHGVTFSTSLDHTFACMQQIQITTIHNV